MLRQIRPHGPARELEVRLVHHHERVGGVKHAQHELLARERARGVVRTRDDKVVHIALGQAREHGLLVDGEVRTARHACHGSAGEARIRLVHRERRRQVQKRAPRPAPRERHVEQKLVAAVAYEHLLAGQAVGLGDKVAQVVRQRVGIAVERHARHLAHDLAAQLLPHVARVLVRGEQRASRQVFRVVRLKPRQLRRRWPDATHRRRLSRALRLRQTRPPPPPRRRRPRPAGSCASRRSWSAPIGPRGGRWP